MTDSRAASGNGRARRGPPRPFAGSQVDWLAAGCTVGGLVLGLVMDLLWSPTIGLWALMLALLGLVLGEALSAGRDGSLYRK